MVNLTMLTRLFSFSSDDRGPRDSNKLKSKSVVDQEVAVMTREADKSDSKPLFRSLPFAAYWAIKLLQSGKEEKGKQN